MTASLPLEILELVSDFVGNNTLSFTCERWWSWLRLRHITLNCKKPTCFDDLRQYCSNHGITKASTVWIHNLPSTDVFLPVPGFLHGLQTLAITFLPTTTFVDPNKEHSERTDNLAEHIYEQWIQPSHHTLDALFLDLPMQEFSSSTIVKLFGMNGSLHKLTELTLNGTDDAQATPKPPFPFSLLATKLNPATLRRFQTHSIPGLSFPDILSELPHLEELSLCQPQPDYILSRAHPNLNTLHILQYTVSTKERNAKHDLPGLTNLLISENFEQDHTHLEPFAELFPQLHDLCMMLGNGTQTDTEIKRLAELVGQAGELRNLSIALERTGLESILTTLLDGKHPELCQLDVNEPDVGDLEATNTLVTVLQNLQLEDICWKGCRWPGTNTHVDAYKGTVQKLCSVISTHQREKLVSLSLDFSGLLGTHTIWSTLNMKFPKLKFFELVAGESSVVHQFPCPELLQTVEELTVKVDTYTGQEMTRGDRSSIEELMVSDLKEFVHVLCQSSSALKRLVLEFPIQVHKGKDLGVTELVAFVKERNLESLRLTWRGFAQTVPSWVDEELQLLQGQVDVHILWHEALDIQDMDMLRTLDSLAAKNG